GIRDRTVTGVQTCALPIFTYRRSAHLSAERLRSGAGTDAARAWRSRGRSTIGVRWHQIVSLWRPNMPSWWMYKCNSIGRDYQAEIGRVSVRVRVYGVVPLV